MVNSLNCETSQTPANKPLPLTPEFSTVFLKEHFAGFAHPGTRLYGSPKAYTALPAAMATYSFPSTANAIGAA